ncbi:hypothetical protein [Corallococcus llansteffanensis]|uniref:Uncharacterized protein n=1 Tax=Corallococcus llansteffanensis TaxID=2316731 RepID=A0A3A8PF42_9BACT|nr:hypothetical protein [Corallococcus llansteffanensis]RKH54986.1 hypothetical protein D7V93_24165 [Corallococcus llansteffanensis]
MESLNEHSDVVRWLRAECASRQLARIELSASLKHQAEVYDDTLIFTAPDGALTFGALPEAQREQVQALLRQHHAADPARGNIELSVVCEANLAPRILLTDELRKQREEREQARAEAHFDARPYGRALALRVAEILDAGGELSVAIDPRDGVFRALWKPGDGTYVHGLRYAQGDSQPTATFASREEFIRWLAQRSDEVFAKEAHPDDPRMWGLGTFNRAFFARKTGRRS